MVKAQFSLFSDLLYHFMAFLWGLKICSLILLILVAPLYIFVYNKSILRDQFMTDKIAIKYHKHESVHNEVANKSGAVTEDNGETVTVRCAGELMVWDKNDIDLIVHVPDPCFISIIS
jgi:hypothetical protein